MSFSNVDPLAKLQINAEFNNFQCNFDSILSDIKQLGQKHVGAIKDNKEGQVENLN